jgi:pimeloyl-ACP methyl ester carboxylesterase
VSVSGARRIFCGGIVGDVGSHHEAVCALRIGTMMQRYVLDNMVRVSLLETIPGVDWGRIYTAGLSLGGWQALWTAALDRRVSRVVAAGIFKRLDKMVWQSADDLCQTIPALSTAFLAYGSLPSLLIPQLITQQSMLITTPDIAALIFGHAALLSTWSMKDSGWGQVGDTLTDTTQVAAETGGTYLSEIAPRLLEASIPNSHEFYSFMPTPGKGPLHLDQTLGAIPFLLGGPPTMITSLTRRPVTQPSITAAGMKRRTGSRSPVRNNAGWVIRRSATGAVRSQLRSKFR